MPIIKYMDGFKKKNIVLIALLFACIIIVFLYVFFIAKRGREEIDYKAILTPISLSGALKEYKNTGLGIRLDIPEEYRIDDTKFSKDFPYVGFTAPGYDSYIEATHWPKNLFFRDGGFKKLEEYFLFKKDFWKSTGFWIEGDSIILEGTKAYYMVTKLGGAQKESTVLLEKGDDIYQVKLFEFREDPKNSEILKKVIQTIKFTD